MNRAEFRFYEELNTFLPPERRKTTFAYAFQGHPAVKDAIEALGVPHTEVDLIVVNGVSVDFSYQLRNGDRVAVYPVFETLDVSPLVRLRDRPLRRPRFVLDVHLGKLARLLRMLGFDTLYRNDYEDADIVRIAVKEKRIVLTRDRGLLKHGDVTHGYWLRSTQPHEQLREVLQRFDLRGQIEPFTRCMRCNGHIESVDPAAVADRLPPKTAQYFDEFYRCSECGKIYWPGSHYERMQALVEEFMEKRDPGNQKEV